MIQVYSSPDLSDAHAVKNLLEANGIAAYIFNENISQLPGSHFRATPDAWPAVHILDEGRLGQVKMLIKTFEDNQRSQERKSSVDAPPWICAHCKEENVDTFEICWKCGRSR